MKVMNKKWTYGIYAIVYIGSFCLSANGLYYLSGASLISVAIFLYSMSFLETKNLVNAKGIFSLSWIGGQGLACLQLSELQTDWHLVTWICFFLAYISFCIGYGWKNKHIKTQSKDIEKSAIMAKRILRCIIILMTLSIACFLLEAIVVGFIPLFSDLPHAYSYFHVTGVHYFTISCILIPALTVIYSKVVVLPSKREIGLVIIGNIVAVMVPILCVSRFQLMFAVLFAAVTYVAVYRKLTVKMVLIALACMIPAYILLTLARNHDVAYLNGIFEMKHKTMPIFITQPYMYIVNNYENFNCLVEGLTTHSFGIRMLFPFFALTGLKFVYPQVTAWPMFITKEELTTLTMFYDGYYDFGILGVVLLAIGIGLMARVLNKRTKTDSNPIIYLFYGQLIIYLALSFFTTWFSNPTTWFWFALTTVMYLYIGHKKKVK